MRLKALLILALAVAVGVTVYQSRLLTAAPRPENSKLPLALARLLPLHKTLGKPQPGDWLDKHDERGQTLDEYLKSGPVRANHERRVIYVQPLGEFNATQRKIIELTAEFLGHYFQLPTRMADDLPLSIVPEQAWRQRTAPRQPQLRTPYVLYDLLKPRLPQDAVVYLALTTADVTPGEEWNYVFGQASLADRVGVWSIHRLGEPAESPEAFRLTLRRTLGIAAHETGHMFSLAHCVYFECCMCGCNHLEEADRMPLWLCPYCLGKLLHATSADPAKRFEALAAFAKAQRLDAEADFWRKSLATIGKP